MLAIWRGGAPALGLTGDLWQSRLMSTPLVTTPPDLPPHVHAFLVRITTAYQEHDTDQIIELLDPSIEFLDHRPLGSEPIIGHDAARTWLTGVLEFVPDFHVSVTVLAHDGADRYLARDHYSGQGADTFGAAELEWYVVDQLRDGKLLREEMFADEAAARAAFARALAST
jgi:hypothetical protein